MYIVKINGEKLRNRLSIENDDLILKNSEVTVENSINKAKIVTKINGVQFEIKASSEPGIGWFYKSDIESIENLKGTEAVIELSDGSEIQAVITDVSASKPFNMPNLKEQVYTITLSFIRL